MLKRILIVMLVVLTGACSSNNEQFSKSPVDNLIRDMDKEKNFTIILYDMDIEDKAFSETYKHKYKVITQKDSIPTEKLTDWYEVSEREFAAHENDMGMEIAAKTNGKVSKTTAPPGYSNYVGNQQYGRWTTGSNGTSFWEFYGQYAFMSSMFGLASGMINRNHYNDYYTNYRGHKPYYGTIGSGNKPMFGTYSDVGRRANPDFHARTQSSSAFKNRVNSRVSRSDRSSSRSSGSSSSGGGMRSRRRR